MKGATLTLQASIPKNGQTHSNNSWTIGTKMFDELLSFCWVGS